MGNFKNIEELKEEINKGNVSKFKIKVIANAKNNNIEFSDDFIKIRIKAPALEGKANKAIIEFLSDVLNKPKSKVIILNGEKSSIKTIEVKN